MVCKNCGAQLEDGLVFCTECGSAQEPASAEQTSPAVPGVCPSCGAAAAEGVIFCTECGAPMDGEPVKEAPPTFCINCGAALAPGSAFCTGCGAGVGQPVGKAAGVAKTKAPKAPMNKKKLMTFAAYAAGVVVVCALGIQIFGAASPNAAVLKAVDKTVKELMTAPEKAVKNIAPLAVMKQNMSKANTQKLELQLRGSLSDLLGSNGVMLEAMKPQLKIETDLPGKTVLMTGTVMGSSYYAAANDGLVGISAPLFLGDKIFAADTKTLGMDLLASPMFGEDIKHELKSYYGKQIDLSKLSFTLFDKPQELERMMTEVGLSNSKDYDKVKGDLKKALTAAASELEVERGDKVSLDFEDGKTVKGREYEVKVTPAMQKKLLTAVFNSVIATDSAKEIFARQGVTKLDIDNARSELQKLAAKEYTAVATIDNKGRLVKVSSEISPQLGVVIQLELSFNNYAVLADDISLSGTVITPYGQGIVTLSSVGNHTGKGGGYEDTTQLSINVDGDTVAASISTAYEETDGKGEFSCTASATVPYSKPISISIGGEITTSKSKKTVAVDMNRISINAAGIINAPIDLSMKYNLQPGVSDKAKQYFDKTKTMMILKMSEEELAKQLAGYINGFGYALAPPASAAPAA